MIHYILDTDHLSLYERHHPQISEAIISSRQSSLELLTITVVTVEEQFAGRLSQIRKAKTPETLIEAYRRLQQTYHLFADLPILAYTADADQKFRELRRAGIRIGTQDLRIASIVLTHDGVLVTRNVQDFLKVPGLKIQDWSVRQYTEF